VEEGWEVTLTFFRTFGKDIGKKRITEIMSVRSYSEHGVVLVTF